MWADRASSTSRQYSGTSLHPHEAATLIQFAVLMLCCFYAYHLPTPKPANAPMTTFSEQRARTHLHSMISYGVRTVGSVANEVKTPRYIGHAIEKLRRAAPAGVEIELVMQHPSGPFKPLPWHPRRQNRP